MRYKLALLCLLAVCSLASCERQRPRGPIPVRTAAAVAGQDDGWSISALRKSGFNATSRAVVTVDRGDSPVTISDSGSLNLLGSGDFSFARTRTHEGAADGASNETTSAVRKGRDYYTAASSALWVHWDDAIGQPESLVDAFIENEDSILRMVHQCGKVGAADESGRSAVSLPAGPCEFVTVHGSRPTKPYSGTIRDLSGSVVVADGVPSDIAVKIRFDSLVEGVPVAVTMDYSLKVSTGEGQPDVVAPASFRESRRPRPVRMVESVLGGMVDEWGPGAPENLRSPATRQ